MEKLSNEARKIMNERFGHDTLIALATVNGNIPCVRTVNGYYARGAFYAITHILRIRLIHGRLFSHGTRYAIDFTAG